jgi:hypothetical protein
MVVTTMAWQATRLARRATDNALVKPLARDCIDEEKHDDGVKRNRFLDNKVSPRAARSAAQSNGFGREADNHYI